MIETTTNKVEDNSEDAAITEPSTEPPTLKPSKPKLPITSAKIMKMITKKPTTTTTMETIIVEEENYPKAVLKKLKIDPKEVVKYPVHKPDNKVCLEIMFFFKWQ